MSHSKVLMTVVNFETRDRTQQDIAISTVVSGFFAHLFTYTITKRDDILSAINSLHESH